MKKLLLLFLLFSTINGFTQDLKSLIKQHTVNIISNNPNDTIFPDLEFLRTTIGAKRVVMLGEQDHGDAATFEAKTRIVKFLNQEMGFDVIAFESDFFGIQSAWHEKDSNGLTPVLDHLWPMWTGCEQNKPFFLWVENKAKSNELHIAGFDSRHAMSMYRRPNYYFTEINNLINNIGSSIAKHDSCARFVEVMKEIIKKEYWSKCTVTDRTLFYSFLKEMTTELQKVEVANKPFWMQELKNMRGQAENAWSYQDGDTNLRDIRDEQMADNLLWLIQQQYPKKKIIVWAANSHIAKNATKPTSTKDEKTVYEAVTMGSFINDKIADELYIIGFTSYQGKGGRITVRDKFDIPPANENTLEDWLYSTDFNFGFLNLAQLENVETMRFTSKLFGHKKILTQNLGNMFDGIYYIKEMYPCIAMEKPQ